VEEGGGRRKKDKISTAKSTGTVVLSRLHNGLVRDSWREVEEEGRRGEGGE